MRTVDDDVTQENEIVVLPDARDETGDPTRGWAPEASETSEPPETPSPGPRIAIDPRIRERRVMITREQGRRRLRILVVAVAAIVLALVAYWVVNSPLLDIDHVRVQGATHVSEEQVLAVARVQRGAPILFEDLGAIAKRVETLPWVAHASVTRDLPGTIRITVTERSESVWARRSPTEVALIGADGRVVTNAPAPPDGVVELRGLAHVPPVGKELSPTTALRVLHQLPDDFRPSVLAITVDHGQVTLAMGFGLEVRMGDPEDVPSKAAAAAAVIKVLPRKAHYVDVRVPGAPAVG